MSEVATISVQLGLGGSYPEAVIADAPHYYHRLQELSLVHLDIAYDEMGNGDGTYFGTGVEPTHGVASPLAEGAFAVDFGASEDYIQATAPSTPSTFSLEAWVYHEAWPADIEPIVVLRGTPSTLTYLSVESGALTGHVATSAGQLALTGSTLSDDTWYLVAMTWDGSRLRLYKNGVLDATSAAHGGTLSAVTLYRIGRELPDFYSGRLCEVAYYADVVLSATRALAHYTAAAWTDVTADVRDAVTPVAQYGISGSGPADRVASPGSCAFALDNSDSNSAATAGYYSPDHASVRSGFDIGIPMRLALTYGGTTYYKFRGTLASIQPTPSSLGGPWLTHCVVLDWMDEAERTRLATVPIQIGETASQLFKLLVDNTARKPGGGVSIADTSDIYPYVFDNSNDEGVSLLTESQRLAMCEVGFVYVKGDTAQGGVLVLESRTERAGKGSPSSTLDVASFVQHPSAFQVERSRDQILNRIQVTVHPRRVDAAATTILFTLSDTNTVIEIPSGETLSIVCPYTDPVQRDSRIGGTGLVTPAATTDYLMNTAADGSGSNITGDLTVEADFGANAGFLTLTNANAVTGYVTHLQLRGKGIYDMQRVLFAANDEDSQMRYGTKAFAYEMPYQSSAAIGRDAARYLLGQFSAQASRVSSVSVLGSASATAMTAALAREIGDRVTLTETQTGISADFHIQRISLAMPHVGQGQVDVVATWSLVPATQQSMWLLGVAGASEVGVSTVIGF